MSIGITKIAKTSNSMEGWGQGCCACPEVSGQPVTTHHAQTVQPGEFLKSSITQWHGIQNPGHNRPEQYEPVCRDRFTRHSASLSASKPTKPEDTTGSKVQGGIKSKMRTPNRTKRKVGFVTFLSIFTFACLAFAEKPSYTLDECLNIAETNNPELRAQLYKIEETNFRYRQALANKFPQVEANLSYLRYDKQLPSKKALFGPSLNDFYAELSVRQLLFDSGKTSSKIKSSQATISAEMERYDELRRAVHLSVKKAYYELLRAQLALDIQQRLIDKLNEQFNIATLLYSSGKTTHLDVLKIQTQLAVAEDVAENLRNLANTNSFLLAQAMGVEQPVSISLALPEIDENTKYTIHTSCVENGFANSPQIKYLENLMERADCDISAEIAELYPSVFFRANHFWEDKTFFPGNPNWYVGIGVSLPIYRGGAIRARIDQAKSRKSQIIENQRQVRLNLTARFQSARATVIDRINRVSTTRKVLDLARETLTTAEIRYNAGKITATELLDAQTMWLNSELSYINNIIDCRIAIAEVEYICPEAISVGVK